MDSTRLPNFTNWNAVPWTPFQRSETTGDDLGYARRPDVIMMNSRYQVSMWAFQDERFGAMVHLSIKTHDRQARHDWRDLQRIKNELCGPECDAIEVYPAESKLVDAANQYHLFVFRDFKLPFGFQTRLVADGNWNGSRQRPWPVGERPDDCMNSEQFEAHFKRVVGAGTGVDGINRQEGV